MEANIETNTQTSSTVFRESCGSVGDRFEQDRVVKDTRSPKVVTNLRTWGFTEPGLPKRDHAGSRPKLYIHL